MMVMVFGVLCSVVFSVLVVLLFILLLKRMVCLLCCGVIVKGDVVCLFNVVCRCVFSCGLLLMRCELVFMVLSMIIILVIKGYRFDMLVCWLCVCF